MCCNTKAGPRAAIAFFKKKTGIHVTQADWHKIRKAAEVSLGRPLTNKVADSHKAAMVAADFADSLAATPEEKKAIIFELSDVRTTEGNVDAIQELANNGLPADVAGKRARKSAQQRENEVKVDESSTQDDSADLPWKSDEEPKSMWQRAEIKMVGVSNYPAVHNLLDGEPIYVEHEPDNAYDPNAMRISNSGGETLGYLPKVVAERVLNETGERAFTAHIANTTNFDGKTVGGTIVLDNPVPFGYAEEMEELHSDLADMDRFDSDNLPD